MDRHGRAPRALLAVVAAALLLPSWTTRATDNTPVVDGRVRAHLASLREGLDPRAAETLDRIDGLDRQLLAMRSYLRAGASLGERWSWSQAQIDRYEGSALQRALESEIARVRAAFAAENPGYTLWVNPQVRSVELQVERWNENPSVAAAATAMLASIRREVASTEAPNPGGATARDWFSGRLRSAVPTPTPTLAAPGLSRHGRMQAVDFQVKQGERVVAGPSQADIGPVWEAQGWCERLVRAVRTASDRFDGPLVTPNEPWHYEYEPEEELAARNQGESKWGGSLRPTPDR
jgi:hypothetical protein